MVLVMVAQMGVLAPMLGVKFCSPLRKLQAVTDPPTQTKSHKQLELTFKEKQ